MTRKSAAHVERHRQPTWAELARAARSLDDTEAKSTMAK